MDGRLRGRAAFGEGTSTSVRCPYCGKVTTSANHRRQCAKAPWDEWIKGVWQRLRQGSTADERATWEYKCGVCELPCRSDRARAIHESACRSCRAASGSTA